MSLLALFEIAKLTVTAYRDEDRTDEIGSFEAQYNPDSLSIHYAAAMDSTRPASGSAAPQWRFNNPGRMNVTLKFDGSHVGEFGVVPIFGNPKSVKDRVQEFLERCTRIDSESHEVPYLRLNWSSDIAWSAQSDPPGFDCRLQSVDINYLAFDRDGSPLHAELAAEFVEQLSPQVEAAGMGLASPDLTHRRTVKSGDTLPLLCKEIYGSSKHYLRVAAVNGLDDFRMLTPGTVLSFPPYQKRET